MKKNSSLHCLVGTNVDQAVSILSKGGIIAFPTETFYGLAVDPFNTVAVEKLFLLKERPKDKPILVLVDDVRQLARVTPSIPGKYSPLMKKFWPGPLTLIFQANTKIDPLLTGETGTIGVRISSHPIARDLTNKMKNPVTATSANPSGKNPAKTAEEVFRYFGGKIDYILEGGRTPAGSCSTIVTLKEDRLELIRKGRIPFPELIEYLKSHN